MYVIMENNPANLLIITCYDKIPIKTDLVAVYWRQRVLGVRGNLDLPLGPSLPGDLVLQGDQLSQTIVEIFIGILHQFQTLSMNKIFILTLFSQYI